MLPTLHKRITINESAFYFWVTENYHPMDSTVFSLHPMNMFNN